MALRVTTTGSNVTLDDLGVTITHPTSNRDLREEFTAIELRDSLELTDAISLGTLLADDGTYPIAAEDYDPDEMLLQELSVAQDNETTTTNELYSAGDITIVQNEFPLDLNSTAASTRNVYTVGGKWITWNLKAGDIVVITGNAAAGNYTVESITDQQNFIVVEGIVDSTGGAITVYHPPASTKIGVDSSTLNYSSASSLQDALEDLNNVASFQPNRMIMETDGKLVYSGDGDICLTDTYVP